MADLTAVRSVSLTPQSAATRARLISTAERLFAERGIEATSLNDINIAAGQRNKNATHYHFGDKRGLLQAVLDKHMLPFVARRDAMLGELLEKEEFSIREAVRALLYPLAEKLFDPDGGREFIRINAQLAATHAASLIRGHADVFNLGPMERLNAVRARLFSGVPEPIVQQRVLLGTSLILNGLADHSRELDRRHRSSCAAETELLIGTLEDSLVAMYSASPSAGTRKALLHLAAG